MAPLVVQEKFKKVQDQKKQNLNKRFSRDQKLPGPKRYIPEWLKKKKKKKPKPINKHLRVLRTINRNIC